MKKIAGIALITIVLLCACHDKAKEASGEKEVYQKATEALAAKEKKNPIAFLSVSSHDRRNLLGQTVIKANVGNSAKVCTYKDVQLELSFFSKTGTILEKDVETVYDSIPAGKVVNFKTKYFAPKGSDSISIKILSAKVKE